LVSERIGDSRISEAVPHEELLAIERSPALPDHDSMLGMERHDGVRRLNPAGRHNKLNDIRQVSAGSAAASIIYIDAAKVLVRIFVRLYLGDH
jgi:hypothetical protein